MLTLTRKLFLLGIISTSLFASEIDDNELISDLDFFMAMEIIEEHSDLIDEELLDDSKEEEEVSHES